MEIYALTTEYLENPLGIDASSPRFSWKMKSEKEGCFQKCYKITASRDPEFRDVIWDSGSVSSLETRGILWNGPELHSREKIYWKVNAKTVSKDGDEENAESETATFEMGLLSEADWSAKWIEPEDQVNPDIPKPVPYLRKKFMVRTGLLRARIYQTSHGLYEFWLNGEKCTEDLFTPGFTSYYHRLQYQVYDITDKLSEGLNIWSVRLADGWWRGCTGGVLYNNFGYKLAYLGQIELFYEDGSAETVVSDGMFKTSTGGLLKSDMKFGDTFDATLEPEGWTDKNFDDSAWKSVKEMSYPTSHLIASRSFPVRRRESFTGKLIKTPNHETVLDFGQNIAGNVICRFRNPQKGSRIILTHGEALDKKGNFTMKNMHVMGAIDGTIQEISYIPKGLETEEYCPSFCVFGFRYLRIEGYDGPVAEGDFTATAIYSDMEETGDFRCSNELINKLVSNARWSQKGNFLDVPTDCPTRERNAWSGDAQIYCRTAAEFMDVYPFYEKWMADYAVEQYASGKVPNTVPATSNYHNRDEMIRLSQKKRLGYLDKEQLDRLEGTDNGVVCEGSAGWGDVVTILPWTIYQVYGDKRILEEAYLPAKRWVDYELSRAKEENPLYKSKKRYKTYIDGEKDADYIWDTDFHWGEHLDTAGKRELIKAYIFSLGNLDKFFRKKAKKGSPSVATAYMAHSAELLSFMAETLGYEDDKCYYKAKSKKIKAAYERHFINEKGVTDDGITDPKMQAPDVRALKFDLCTGDKRSAVAANLIEKIEKSGRHLNTGFLSTPYILGVLADEGRIDLSYAILEQTDDPSWLEAVRAGATTVPESWEAFDTLGGSLNHYSYGAVCDFLFSYVAGIQLDSKCPGFRHFILHPQPGGTLNQAEAVYESPNGKIRSAWKIDESGAEYCFTIPCNTSATIILPDREPFEASSGKYCFRVSEH